MIQARIERSTVARANASLECACRRLCFYLTVPVAEK